MFVLTVCSGCLFGVLLLGFFWQVRQCLKRRTLVDYLNVRIKPKSQCGCGMTRKVLDNLHRRFRFGQSRDV
ncbi:MAG: hypothetical protein ABIH23_29830 [bacterium]